MKQTIYESDFIRAFENAGRKDQFTREALIALYEHFEQLEADTGEELELDVIGICCDYCEDTFENIAENYSIDLIGCVDDLERELAVIDYLTDHTFVCGTCDNGRIVYQQF